MEINDCLVKMSDSSGDFDRLSGEFSAANDAKCYRVAYIWPFHATIREKKKRQNGERRKETTWKNEFKFN